MDRHAALWRSAGWLEQMMKTAARAVPGEVAASGVAASEVAASEHAEASEHAASEEEASEFAAAGAES